tara:strand:- start:59 stop:244 length:186 start_codon:yes stop_codon:yes gene_type:complete
MALERRIQRKEKRYSKAARKYTEKTGEAPYTAFTPIPLGGGKPGKKLRRINRKLGKLYRKI